MEPTGARSGCERGTTGGSTAPADLLRSLLIGIFLVHADMKRAAPSYQFFRVRSDRLLERVVATN